LGDEIVRDHTLAWIETIVAMHEADSVSARMFALRKEWRKLGKELFASDTFTGKLGGEALVSFVNGKEMVVGSDSEVTHIAIAKA